MVRAWGTTGERGVTRHELTCYHVDAPFRWHTHGGELWIVEERVLEKIADACVGSPGDLTGLELVAVGEWSGQHLGLDVRPVLAWTVRRTSAIPENEPHQPLKSCPPLKVLVKVLQGLGDLVALPSEVLR